MKPEDKEPKDKKVTLIKVEDGETKEEFKKRVIEKFRKRGFIAEKEEPEQPEGGDDQDG